MEPDSNTEEKTAKPNASTHSAPTSSSTNSQIDQQKIDADRQLRDKGIAPECGGIQPEFFPPWVSELTDRGEHRSDYTDLVLPKGDQDIPVNELEAVDNKSDTGDMILAEPRKWILPSGELGYEEGSKPFFKEFARRELLFLQDDKIVEVLPNRRTAEHKIAPVDHSTFRCRVERVGEIWEFRKRGDTHMLGRGRCSEELAKAMIKTLAKFELNTISLVLRCPVIIES
jgi:hypothetical protein